MSISSYFYSGFADNSNSCSVYEIRWLPFIKHCSAFRLGVCVGPTLHSLFRLYLAPLLANRLGMSVVVNSEK